jgi:hypothetical protein
MTKVLRIEYADGTVQAVHGKVADLIFWMIQNHSRIERMPQGQLVLNWGANGKGGSFRAELRETFDSTPFTR